MVGPSSQFSGPQCRASDGAPRGQHPGWRSWRPSRATARVCMALVIMGNASRVPQKEGLPRSFFRPGRADPQWCRRIRSWFRGLGIAPCSDPTWETGSRAAPGQECARSRVWILSFKRHVARSGLSVRCNKIPKVSAEGILAPQPPIRRNFLAQSSCLPALSTTLHFPVQASGRLTCRLKSVLSSFTPRTWQRGPRKNRGLSGYNTHM
jgi:hypothetical protein